MLNYRHKIIFILALITTLSVAFFSFQGVIASANENIDTKNTENIRFFVGGYIGNNLTKAAEYLEKRIILLNDFAANKPEEEFTAVVTFKTFQSISDIETFLDESNAIVDEIWFSIPGRTGRFMAKVVDNKVENVIDDFVKTVKSSGSLENNKEEREYISEVEKGNYGIFALTTKAKGKDYTKIKEKGNVKLVDLMYDAEAIELAQKSNRPVSYIALPEKPDGTR